MVEIKIDYKNDKCDVKSQYASGEELLSELTLAYHVIVDTASNILKSDYDVAQILIMEAAAKSEKTFRESNKK